MTSVAFYNSEILPGNAIFDSPVDEESYQLFAGIFSEKGGDLYIVRGRKNYVGENRFCGGWKYEDGSWIEITEDFSVDLIFNKGSDLPPDQPLHVINHPEIMRRCLKYETAELFPEDCPRTVRVSDAKELATALDAMHTDKVVLKPLDSFGGRGIFIGSKEEIVSHIDAYPLLLQEFMDTSKGIPGICDGLHDVRLIFIGDSLVECYLREPAKGKLLSNVAQGGRIKRVPLERVPQGARALAFKVDRKMADFPDRIYCVDMGLHDGKTWKIFELNAPPGMPLTEEGYDIRPHLRLLADHLLGFAQRSPE